MKIALLSDIHGNSCALKAIYKKLKKESIKNLFILGDIVGYYYDIRYVLDILENFKTIMISGNHEIFLKKTFSDKKLETKIYKKYGSGIIKAKKELKFNELEFLTNLPTNKILKINNLKINLSHGTPWNINSYIYPDNNKKNLNKCINNTKSNIICLGHTHYPLFYRKNNQILINPGSVGQSRLEGGIANWITLDLKNKLITFKNTSYETKKLIEKVIKIDPHIPYLHKVLKRKNTKKQKELTYVL